MMACDKETRHIVELVQRQMTEKKKKSGLPRATYRNTIHVAPEELLDAPDPKLHVHPPGHNNRGGHRHNGSGNRGGYRSHPTFSLGGTRPARKSPILSFGNCVSTRTSYTIPRVSAQNITTVSVPHLTRVQSPLIRVQASPTPIQALLPLIQVATPLIRVPPPLIKVPLRVPVSSLVQIPIIRVAPTSQVTVPVRVSDRTDTSVSFPVQQQASSMSQEDTSLIPVEKYVPPAGAIPFTLMDLKKKKSEIIGDMFFITARIIRFKAGDPRSFQVKLEDAPESITVHERMMNTLFEYNHARPNYNRLFITRGNIIIYGYYAAHDKDRSTWCRVQVVNVTQEDEKPVNVFLIDHGVYKNIDFTDLAYLKDFHTKGIVRCAFNATCASLPHEPRLNGPSANLFMKFNVGHKFVFIVMGVETVNDDPVLQLRFACNLDKVRQGNEKPDYNRVGVVF